MINALIIDDEPGNRENLRFLLEKHCPDIQVVGEAANAAEGIDQIGLLMPDLVFLDIEMPKGTGFDMLEKLPSVDFEVIFVTAYDQYAIKAIKFCALDYLLKPIELKEFKNAVNRVREKWEAKQENKRLQAFLENLRTPPQAKRIALTTAERVDFVMVDDIIRCQGDNNYTHFYLANGKHMLVSKTLKEYEELLKDHHFIRVHQSHLIHLHQVKSWVKQDGGYILMADGSQVPVSQRRKEKVFARLRS